MDTTVQPCEITTDTARFDIDAIHRFLSASYWAQGIPRATLERAIANIAAAPDGSSPARRVRRAARGPAAGSGHGNPQPPQG